MKYPLGTDDQGRDILSALMYGARISLVVGLASGERPSVVGLVGVGLAIVAVARPAPLLPQDTGPEDPFAAALRVVELESGRLLQPSLRLLRQMAEAMPRAIVEDAVAARQAAVARLWNATLHSLLPPA